MGLYAGWYIGEVHQFHADQALGLSQVGPQYRHGAAAACIQQDLVAACQQGIDLLLEHAVGVYRAAVPALHQAR